MFKVILADLKAQFGVKVLLSPEDIAEIINISVGQQANMRSEGKFPIPYEKVGGRVRITIYDLAEYLANCCTKKVKQEMKQLPVALSRSEKKATKGHLANGWWKLRCRQIIAVIRKSIFSNDLRVNPPNSLEGIGKI